MCGRCVLRRVGAALRNMRGLLIPIGPGPAPGQYYTVSSSSQESRPSLPWGMGGCHAMAGACLEAGLWVDVHVSGPDCQNPQCFAVQGPTDRYYPSQVPT